MTAKKMEWIASFVLFGVGGIFLIFSIVMAVYDINFKSNAIEHAATITQIDRYRDSDGDTRHRVYVTYSVDGLEYNEPLGHYSSSMYVGKETQIYYKPESPSRIIGKSFILMPIIFFIVALIILSIGFIISFIKIKKKKSHKQLFENGRKIYAEITDVTRNTSYTVNGKNPFTITCKWIDPSTGLFYFFRSPNIWFNPEYIIEERQIQSLAVHIDRENPKRYVVSLDEVEKFLGSA